MVIIIDDSQAGKTVKSIIYSLGISQKMLRSMKQIPDGICVNGQHVTVRYVLSVGDSLSLKIQDEYNPDFLFPVNLPCQVLFEDDDVMVLNKPSNMPTHPSHDHYNDTLANALAFLFQTRGVPFVFRPVNRLDRNTSGAVLVAKNRLAASYYVDEMKKGKIKKQYLAVLDGEMTEKSGVIHRALHRTAQSIIVREVCDDNFPDAQDALTEYQVLATGQGHSLVLATPKTGRTHQLRVHFASIGFPICGDDLYGQKSSLIDRQALHAVSLTFEEKNNHTVKVTAPLPEDIQTLVQQFFGGLLLDDIYE